jgi:hypothetical protein
MGSGYSSWLHITTTTALLNRKLGNYHESLRLQQIDSAIITWHGPFTKAIFVIENGASRP